MVMRHPAIRRVESLGDPIFVDRLAADQVLLNDPLQYRWVAEPIPDSIGINDRDRAAGADSKAGDF